MRRYVFVFGLVSVLILLTASVLGTVKTFPIQETPNRETNPSVAYNFQRDEFLTVWRVLQSGVYNIYGRIVKSSGEFTGPAFPICISKSTKYLPDVAYGVQNEYLVVWHDSRGGKGDIYGTRLDYTGKKLVQSTSILSDTTFVICNHDSAQFVARVAANTINNTYLVVWQDLRNSTAYKSSYGYMLNRNVDVYGQRVKGDGTLVGSNSNVNFPIADKTDQDEDSPDVAYHGSNGTTLNEWLVVFIQSDTAYAKQGIGRIWGARVKGFDGSILNTWGEKGPHSFAKVAKAAGGTPWYPTFPIGYDGKAFFVTLLDFFQGSPHVASNADWPRLGTVNTILDNYPYKLPEFLVAWTDFRNDIPDIYCQRIAYFPDSIAYRKGLKMDIGGKHYRGADSLFTAVPVDTLCHAAFPPFLWINWANYPVTTQSLYQSYNGLIYNPKNGEYMVAWNDGREAGWDGTYKPPDYIAPQVDIYGQRLHIQPSDSNMVWIGDDGKKQKDKSINIPIVNTRADEGNNNYPGLGHSLVTNQYLISYDFDQSANDSQIDIQGAWYSGTPFTNVDGKGSVELPSGFVLKQNYPNPFNPLTAVEFTLPSSAWTTVRVVDVLGREVAVLADQKLAAGAHRLFWDGRELSGIQAGSGVYFCVIESEKHRASVKMVMMR